MSDKKIMNGFEFSLFREYDEFGYVESPLDDAEPFTVYYKHSRYNLGHEKIDDVDAFLERIHAFREETLDLWYLNRDENREIPYNNSRDISIDNFNGYQCEITLRSRATNKAYYTTQILTERLRKLLKNYGYHLELPRAEEIILALPFYLYDHGGLSVSLGSFSCPWDSGQVGFIVVDRESYENIFGKWEDTPEKRRQLDEYISNWMKRFDDYVGGHIYRLHIECEEIEHYDSIGGIFGSDDMSDIIDNLWESAKIASEDYLKEQEEKLLLPIKEMEYV